MKPSQKIHNANLSKWTALFRDQSESGRFVWPRTSLEARSISPFRFEWLMKGFPIDPAIRLVKPDRSA